MTSQAEDWLRFAQLDLETIEAIIENPRLTSTVAFHAQQCVEKSLKAIIVYYTESIPRIHNIISLLGTTQNYTKIEIDKKILIMLNQVYADTRYPREIENEKLVLPSKNTALLFKNEAEKIYKQVKEKINKEIET